MGGGGFRFIAGTAIREEQQYPSCLLQTAHNQNFQLCFCSAGMARVIEFAGGIFSGMQPQKISPARMVVHKSWQQNCEETQQSSAESHVHSVKTCYVVDLAMYRNPVMNVNGDH
jgi:hypothetical protein